MFYNFRINDSVFACRMVFFVVAFYVGLWTIRVPTIKDQVGTDYLGIGYILASFALGSVILMVLSNKIIKYYSSKKVIEFCAYIHAIVWILAPLIYNIYYFFCIAFLAGCIVGVYEISMNLQASDLEKKNKKSMMSGFHAFFSLGLLTGATVTSIFIELNISFLTNAIIVVAILLPLNISFARLLGSDLQLDNKEEKSNIFFIWPMILFILVLLTITDAFTEGGVDSWAALYMQDKILVTGFKIGLATIFFNIFMVIFRLAGDKIRDILGIYNFLLVSVIFCIFGLIVIFYFNSIFSSILGFSLLGVGISNIVPLAYSIAGKLKNINNAVGISIISIAAYGVFMIGPAALGMIANYFGIGFVFIPMILLFFFCLAVLIFSKKLFA